MLWKENGAIVVCAKCRSIKKSDGIYLSMEEMDDIYQKELLEHWESDNVKFVTCSKCHRQTRKINNDDPYKTFAFKQITPSSIENDVK